MRLADIVHKEEEPHWKLSQVSLQYNTADVTDDDNLGVALKPLCRCLGVYLLVHRDI